MNEQGLNGNRLKLIAVVSMITDHAALALLGPCLAWYAGRGPGEEAGAPLQMLSRALLWLYRSMRSFGRIAFPVFAFLLVEGALHTRSRKQYAARLAVFALFSELPFDGMLGNMGAAACFRSQNVLVTLLLGLLMICGFLWMRRKPEFSGEIEMVAQVLWACCLAVLAWRIRCDYGGYGVILMGILYLFRAWPRTACILGFLWMGMTCAGLQWYYWFGYAAAFALIYRYNGARGGAEPTRRPARGGIPAEAAAWLRRYAWYWVYPVHMAVLCALQSLVFGR